MPSTRKQKAKERRSSQLDMLSDVENVDIMLGSYSRVDEENRASENEMNWDSGSSRPHQSSNVIGEDFRSLLNTNSRESSEATIETTRMINEEISNQMSRKLKEITTGLSFQIQDAINNAITEKILPSIQYTLEMQRRANYASMDRGSIGLQDSSKSANFTTGDRRSSGLQWNSKVESSQKTRELRPKTCFMLKMIDKCLDRVLRTLIQTNKITTQGVQNNLLIRMKLYELTRSRVFADTGAVFENQ